MNHQSFNDIIKQINQSPDLSKNMHYLLIKIKDDCFFHSFKHERTPSDIRSLSKTVMALLTGILIENRDDLTLETPIWPTIKKVVELTNKDNLNKLNKLQVKDLLNHTIGYDQVLMMRQDIMGKDPLTLVDELINTPIVHEPGSYFLYSNAGFYLLSVFLQEFLQEDLLTIVNHYLFKPLNITNFKWQRYGLYLAGATRLWLDPFDLLKIGEVLLNNGSPVVSKDWIDYLRSVSTHTPKHDKPYHKYLRKVAYGQGLWLSESTDLYFGHGTGGQILVILPKEKAIVITIADLKSLSELELMIDTLLSKQIQE